MRLSVIPSGRWLAPVAVLATVVLAAGCGSGSSSSSSATTNVNPSEIPNGGTLNWPLTEPVSMTPIHGQEDQGMTVEKSVFAGLVDYDPTTLATVPSIASSWEHNAKNTVFTFHLRSGVKFQPGQNG